MDRPTISPEKFIVLVQFVMIMIVSFYYILPGAGTDYYKHTNWRKLSNSIIALANYTFQYLPALSPFLINIPASTYFMISIPLFISGVGLTAISNCDRNNSSYVDEAALYFSPFYSLGIIGIGNNCNKTQLSTLAFGEVLKVTSISTTFGGIIAYIKQMSMNDYA